MPRQREAGSVRPDLLDGRFKRIYVNHPSTRLGHKVATGLAALCFVGDGAFEAELSSGEAPAAAVRCETDVDVRVPTGDAQGDALIELVFGHASRCRIHGSLEFIAIAGIFIEQ